MFPSPELLQDFSYFIKRATSILPESLDDVNEITLNAAKDKFYAIRKETTMKRLSAEVEIKLRTIYYDRIERSEVEEAIESIYARVKKLEDIQYMIKYAKSIFPPEPGQLTGDLIMKNLLALREEHARKREIARARRAQLQS